MLAKDLVDEVEVWARLVPDQPGAVHDLLEPGQVQQLTQLCGRCLYRTLTHYVQSHGFGDYVVVLTGDIPAMWTRDSAVQIGSYLPRIYKHPALRRIVEGTIRTQAFFILQDPWANAYNPAYKKTETLPKYDRQLGRGGWVWTRNFELDSSGYFFNLLWNYFRTAAVWRPEELLGSSLVHDAVVAMLEVLRLELDHDTQSPYRYSELTREGLGHEHSPTGMVWSAFRPSDDPNTHVYSIPSNMYVAGALQRLRRINADVWQDPIVEALAANLTASMRAGIEAHGVVDAPDGSGRMYAYEVDGRGKALLDFDDPNLPSLLAIPLLGYAHYDPQIYANTRRRILSSANHYFYTGTKLSGLGSPHTNPGFVWPLATVTQALTAHNSSEQAALLRQLLLMSEGNGLVHESVNVNTPTAFSRPEFGWANAMTVVAVEQLLGVDCDAAAEEQRVAHIREREAAEPRQPAAGGRDLPHYYQLLTADIGHVA